VVAVLVMVVMTIMAVMVVVLLIMMVTMTMILSLGTLIMETTMKILRTHTNRDDDRDDVSKCTFPQHSKGGLAPSH
jgi:cell division protein FtsL